jgi:hypothetical protein
VCEISILLNALDRTVARLGNVSVSAPAPKHVSRQVVFGGHFRDDVEGLIYRIHLLAQSMCMFALSMMSEPFIMNCTTRGFVHKMRPPQTVQIVQVSFVIASS